MGSELREILCKTPRCARLQAGTARGFARASIDKESALAKTAEGYGAQMHDYADAVARLLQIAPDRVKAVLLFTRIGRAVNIDAINKFP